MKKKGIFFVLFLVLILSPLFVQSANQTDAKAYACLEAKVADKCSALSSEEKIFSLLAIQRCKTEVLSDALSGECWPKAGCKIKTTAQAILALNRVNSDTLKAEKWLISQTSTSPDLDWFLQVDAEGETKCTATYTGGTYSFTIKEDKTISGGTGTCLRPSNSYWLKITSSCYDSEFQISCENSFITSLLYKKKTSGTIYVSEKTNSASGEGTTTEKVGSSCFKEGTSCSYEGTLWAALVLKYRKYDVSAYIPYLVAMADGNSKLIPESFLYYLTDSFRTELLAKQIENKWWSASGDKFYDTAVALLPFQSEQLSEKTNSISWLSEVQGADGCWQGNIRNTAFIVYSLWPKKIANVTTAKDCEDSGYYCMSNAACESASGTVMTDYTGCFTNVCCNKAQLLESCAEQNGELCSSDKSCLGGDEVSSSDTTSTKFCCVYGECGEPEEEQSECELQGGYCRSTCLNGEEYSSYSCSTGNCCVAKPTPAVNVLLIIILSVLILLVILGIIFRKKLKMFLDKLKFGKGKSQRPLQPGGPRFPPSSQMIYQRPMQRRIMPQQAFQPRPMPTPVVARSQDKSEFDDVLKKLKDIGKGELVKAPAKPKPLPKPKEKPVEKKEVLVRSHVRKVNTTKK